MPRSQPGNPDNNSCTLYRGRFAPSPTGPLHLGSLIAALASFLDARHNSGRWIVRMEDLDPPREEAGAADRILNSLEAHGLVSDEAVIFQSNRHAAYDEALEKLHTTGQLFFCSCSRADMGVEGVCCSNCRDRPCPPEAVCSRRVSVPRDYHSDFDDRLQGPQKNALGEQLADFVVKRKDGLHAYQLAVVVDDAAQGITHVVRGSDLLDSTPRQIYLQELLGCSKLHYCHIPIITNSDGQKLSKQTFARALSNKDSAQNLRLALKFLHQPEPAAELDSVADILAHAISHWSVQRLPARLAIPADALGIDA